MEGSNGSLFVSEQIFPNQSAGGLLNSRPSSSCGPRPYSATSPKTRPGTASSLSRTHRGDAGVSHCAVQLVQQAAAAIASSSEEEQHSTAREHQQEVSPGGSEERGEGPATVTAVPVSQTTAVVTSTQVYPVNLELSSNHTRNIEELCDAVHKLNDLAVQSIQPVSSLDSNRAPPPTATQYSLTIDLQDNPLRHTSSALLASTLLQCHPLGVVLEELNLSGTNALNDQVSWTSFFSTQQVTPQQSGTPDRTATKDNQEVEDEDEADDSHYHHHRDDGCGTIHLGSQAAKSSQPRQSVTATSTTPNQNGVGIGAPLIRFISSNDVYVSTKLGPLFHSIGSSHFLKHLSMSNCCIDNELFRYFSKGIAENSNIFVGLESIDFSHNRIGSEGLQTFARAIIARYQKAANASVAEEQRKHQVHVAQIQEAKRQHAEAHPEEKREKAKQQQRSASGGGRRSTSQDRRSPSQSGGQLVIKKDNKQQYQIYCTIPSDDDPLDDWVDASKHVMSHGVSAMHDNVLGITKMNFSGNLVAHRAPPQVPTTSLVTMYNRKGSGGGGTGGYQVATGYRKEPKAPLRFPLNPLPPPHQPTEYDPSGLFLFSHAIRLHSHVLVSLNLDSNRLGVLGHMGGSDGGGVSEVLEATRSCSKMSKNSVTLNDNGFSAETLQRLNRISGFRLV